MKYKWILLLLLVLFASMYDSALSISIKPRGYSQIIASPKDDLLKIVTNTGATHNENYLVEVSCSSSPGQVLTTADPDKQSPNVLRIFSLRKGLIQKVFLYVQLSVFENQVNPGDQIHCTVTFIGKGKYYNQSTSWDYFIPEGEGPIIEQKIGEEQLVPPLDKKLLDKQKK